MFTVLEKHRRKDHVHESIPNGIISKWNRMKPKDLCSIVQKAIRTHHKAEFTKYYITEDGGSIAACWTLSDHGLQIPIDSTLQVGFQTGTNQQRRPLFFLGLENEKGRAVVIKKHEVPCGKNPAIHAFVKSSVRTLLAGQRDLELMARRMQNKVLKREQLALCVLMGIGEKTLPQNRLCIVGQHFWKSRELSMWDACLFYAKAVAIYRPIKQMPMIHQFFQTIRAATRSASLKSQETAIDIGDL